jgi:hypothetical protein
MMSSDPKILRPLSIPEMFDEMFSLYRKNFLLFAGIVGLASLPFAIMSALAYPSSLARSGSVIATISDSGVLFMLSLLADTIAMAALTKVIGDRYLGHKGSIFSGYGFVLRRFFPYLFTLILVGITLMLPLIAGIILVFIVRTEFVLLLAVIPIVILAFRFALVTSVFVVEGETFTRAMSRSRKLAQGNWLLIFLIYVLISILGVAAEWGGEALANILVGTASFKTYIWGLVFIQTLLAVIIQPVGLIGFVVLYFDIRVRNEGYDLEMLARDIGAETESDFSSTID